jgi:hypothetical protein
MLESMSMKGIHPLCVWSANAQVSMHGRTLATYDGGRLRNTNKGLKTPPTSPAYTCLHTMKRLILIIPRAITLPINRELINMSVHRLLQRHLDAGRVWIRS